MSELIAYLEAAEKAAFSLSHGLRHQVDSSCMTDNKNSIADSICRTKVALQQALAALEKVGK